MLDDQQIAHVIYLKMNKILLKLIFSYNMFIQRSSSHEDECSQKMATNTHPSLLSHDSSIIVSTSGEMYRFLDVL